MVSEETPPTGDEQQRDTRDQGKPAASGSGAGTAAGQGDPRLIRTDETGDETSGVRRAASAASRARLCSCCGNPLPPPTAQQKKPRKFCPPGLGGYEERYGITCTELGPAKEKYELVFGREAVPAADLEHLSAQIAAAQDLLGPASTVATLFSTLAGTLAGVGDRLDGTVAAALAETARATASEREALGSVAAMVIERDAANELAQQAVLDRQEMERDRNTKVRIAEERANKANEAKRIAEIAQGKAEAERDQHKGRANRAEEAVETARIKLTAATEANVTLIAKNEELTSQLEQANTRADNERSRADQAVEETNRVRAELEQKLDQVRKEAEAKIEKARSDASAAVEAARAETARQSREHTNALERLGRERADELAKHARTLAEANGRAEQLQRRAQDGLARLLRSATTPVEPVDQDDPVGQLHRVMAMQADLRHGIEDLVRDLELD